MREKVLYDNKKMTRSKMAVVQPRDEKGRFAVKEKIGLIDETGDLGNKKSKPYFAMTGMISDNPDALRRIARSYPPDTRKVQCGNTGELKFVTSSDKVRKNVLRDISKTNPTIFSIQTNKYDNNTDWPRNGSKLYVRSTEELINEIAKNENGKIGLIVDENTAIAPERICDICRKANSTYHSNIVCIDPSAKSSKEPLLETNDFVTGSIGYSLNTKKEDRDTFLDIIRKHVKAKNK